MSLLSNDLIVEDIFTETKWNQSVMTKIYGGNDYFFFFV